MKINRHKVLFNVKKGRAEINDGMKLDVLCVRKSLAIYSGVKNRNEIYHYDTKFPIKRRRGLLVGDFCTNWTFSKVGGY